MPDVARRRSPLSHADVIVLHGSAPRLGQRPQYDVVVVGAGPSGSAVARRTAKAGLRTMLVEDNTEVGRPLQCSGFVTPRTLSEAGVHADGLVLNRVKGVWVHGPRGTRLLLGGERVRALALDRVELDRELARRAVAAGVTLRLGARATAIERVDGHVRLTIREGQRGRLSPITAWLLVGADGPNSMVAKWMGVYRRPTVRAVSMDAYLPDHPSELGQVFVGRDIAPGWFAWTIPLGGGLVRIGIGCDASATRASPRELLEQLVKRYPEQFHSVKPMPSVAGFIPLYSSEARSMRISADHVLLVGDAAQQVKPTSGGGIYTGLVGARHAADAILQAFETGDLSHRTLAAYESSLRRELGDEFERARDVRELFRCLSDTQLARLLRLLNFPGIQRLIRQHGDIDFQTPLYGQLLKALPALRTVLSLPPLLPRPWLKLLSSRRSPREVSSQASKPAGDLT